VIRPDVRSRLPKATDRLPVGTTGLSVSPLCLGITSPGVVRAAFEAGVNFFFLTGDLHWPLYEGLRRGLADLFASVPASRDQVVVAVTSYLEEPMFRYLQFHEVIAAVPGLQRVDILVCGAVAGGASLGARLPGIQRARSAGHLGARAIGASFHDRATAVASLNSDLLDLHYIRYNTAHPGAEVDLFPLLKADRTSLLFNFKSMLSVVSAERFHQLGFGGDDWLPRPVDYYRFVISEPRIDGLLCSPATDQELSELIALLEQPPLSTQQREYMAWLSTLATPRYF